jgi:hypothetical protein
MKDDALAFWQVGCAIALNAPPKMTEDAKVKMAREVAIKEGLSFETVSAFFAKVEAADPRCPSCHGHGIRIFQEPHDPRLYTGEACACTRRH